MTGRKPFTDPVLHAERPERCGVFVDNRCWFMSEKRVAISRAAVAFAESVRDGFLRQHFRNVRSSSQVAPT